MDDERLFLCGKCGKMTPFVKGKDKLAEGIEHNYAECQQCHFKHTIMYTDKMVRGLLCRQRLTKKPNQKQKLALEINQKVADLKSKFE